MVFAMEMRVLWSDETVNVIHQFALARAQKVPSYIGYQVTLAWERHVRHHMRAASFVEPSSRCRSWSSTGRAAHNALSCLWSMTRITLCFWIVQFLARVEAGGRAGEGERRGWGRGGGGFTKRKDRHDECKRNFSRVVTIMIGWRLVVLILWKCCNLRNVRDFVTDVKNDQCQVDFSHNGVMDCQNAFCQIPILVNFKESQFED